MTPTTTTHTQPGKKSSRPSVWRQLASTYVDMLICGFIAWVVCFTFAWKSYWPSLTLFLWFGEVIWCRDRLNPTAGEFCLGIRYLTSSSSQVVADIKVIHQKLKLNGFLLGAGLAELTLAIFFFSGWTLLGKVVLFGFTIEPPLSVVYWALMGFAFFLCSGYLLSGSKLAIWVVPIIHGLVMADLFVSRPLWKDLLQNDPLAATSFFRLILSQPFPPVDFFFLWSLFLLGTLVFSRRHLIN